MRQKEKKEEEKNLIIKIKRKKPINNSNKKEKMNLKDLKKMIAEEYSRYLSEQEEPEVAVSDADVDMEGGEDAESTLRDIYDMLKSYFEGGEDAAAGAAAADDMADDTMDDLEDMDDEDEGDEEELDEAKKAGGRCENDSDCGPGSCCRGGSCGGCMDDPTGKSKDLKERFQKLANIIKG